MRKALHLVILALGLAAGSAASEEVPQFKSSGFLDSLGLFSDQHANLAASGKTPSGIKVDFAFRGEPAAHEPGFLYFQEDGAESPVRQIPLSSHAAGFTPRLSALGGRELLGGGITASFTPRAGSAEVRISLTSAADDDAMALSLTLRSEFLDHGTTGFGGGALFSNTDALSPLDRRSRSFGVTLAWLGFKVGASLNREEGGLRNAQDGFDLGIGYRIAAFTTELSFGEYSDGGMDALFGIRSGSFTRLELGAAYEISERLRVSGGVRLFDYSNRFDIGGNSADRSGLLYLGTRFNF